VLVALLGFAAWWLLRPQDRKSKEAFTGYVVSDDVTMSSPIGGTLTRILVRRGDRVTPGQTLFNVDQTVRAAQADQANALIAAGQAQVLQQLAVVDRARANLAAARSDVDRAAAELHRLTAAQREKPGAVAPLQVEQSDAAYKASAGRLEAARADLADGMAGVQAARAQVRQAQAGLASANRQLSDLAPVAPSAGRIEDVMFKQGESVSANAAVVSIVPDGEVKVRFYVPEGLVAGYRPGREVAVACDGCKAGMTATVEFVATRPEYTPPIIYSLDARQKLVFMVEARPSDPSALVPGQPIDVGATADDLKRR
jgi:HlyD family secretion protein